MSTNTIAQRYTLIDGPSVDRIWDAARYAFDKNSRVSLEFVTDTRTAGPIETSMRIVLRPRILGVTHEDGSGDSLIITGTVQPLGALKGALTERQFKAYYKGRTRHGFIEVYA